MTRDELRDRIGRFWPQVNQLRGELIDGRLSRTITDDELIVLAGLSYLADSYLRLFDSRHEKTLDALELRLRETERRS